MPPGAAIARLSGFGVTICWPVCATATVATKASTTINTSCLELRDLSMFTLLPKTAVKGGATQPSRSLNPKQKRVQGSTL